MNNIGVSRFDNQYSIHSADQIIYSFALLFKIRSFFCITKFKAKQYVPKILLLNKYGFYWKYLGSANTRALSYA